MQPLIDALSRFAGGQASRDDLCDVFREYLQQDPTQRAAVANWVQEGVESGRISEAMKTSLCQVLDATATDNVTQVRGKQESGAVPRTAVVASPDVFDANPDTPSELRAGVVLKRRFTLVRELGRGGMGTVFLARDRNKEDARDRNPFVAVKILSDDFRQHPDSFVALQREARRAQTLAHPNVITVYDFDRDGPHTYMTMEYLEGLPLDEWMLSEAGRTAGFEQRWNIVRSVGAALAYGHEKGVVHSDLKPSNIFLCDTGTVKVLDFGISRPMALVSGQKQETVFDPAKRLGGLTPAYASLEQWADSEPDPRDDIYSFGCVTYELFSGRHPFAHASAREAAASALTPGRVDGLSHRQWDALCGALAFNRADRTPAVNQFLQQFAPVTLVRRYRLPLLVAVLAIVATGLYFVYGALSNYVEDRTIGTQTGRRVSARQVKLTLEQQRDVEDTLTLADQSLQQARTAAAAEDLIYLLSEGANNVSQMLDSVQTLDPANRRAQTVREAATQMYADWARRSLKQGETAKAASLAGYGLKLEPDNGGLFRLRKEIMDKCDRDSIACNGK